LLKLEDGYHKWICFDHSHPHIFVDGRCINCGIFEDEITLPPDLQAVWNFAVSSANLYDMDRRGVQKMNPELKDMIEHKKITLRIQDGKVIKIKKAYMDEEKEK